jgi:pyruvate dehydrogenase E2 component (dihydrolipoamide acetyltransferase)
MAEKFLMPKLSPTMEEGQIARWVKNEGDAFEGTLLKILKGAGDTAALGEAIAITGKVGEDISSLLKEIGSNGKSEPPAVAGGLTQAVDQSKKEDPPKKEDLLLQPPATAGGSDKNGRMIVSPIAARMAADNDVDLRSITGSGPNGRIIKRDIEEALESKLQSPKSKEAKVFTPSTIVGASPFREENTSKMRQVIASRLAESLGPIPTFYLTVEIEMDNVVSMRKQINANLDDDSKISVNDIIVKVAAMSLMKHPFVNASYQDKTIRFYEQADIGVAVAIDAGLITPVVRGANLKGFAEISAEIKDLAAKAKAKKLQPEEYTGATFSISNLGMMGIKEFTAIINPPEAAIIAVGGANATPVVRDGQVTVRSIMNVTMSCDHRVIDGATGAKFLQTFKQMLETPALMLM